MTPKEWRAETHLTSNLEEPEPEPEGGLDPDRKFIVAVLADLKGSAGGDPKATEIPLPRRRFLEIDRDNLDEVMGRLKPGWNGRLDEMPGFAESGEAVRVNFAGLDDFHPDRLVQAIPALRRIHDLRGKLHDTAGMDEAESWLRECTQKSGIESEPSPAPPAPDVDSAGLLDSILGESAVRPAAKAAGDLEMQRFLRQIVEPHLVRVDTGRQTALRSALDQVLSYLVCGILHDRAFQSLEATWRNLNWLARNVDTDSSLKIWILHLRKDEVLRDIMAGGDLEDSGMARLLLDPASVPGSERPSILVGDYEFSQGLEDLAVLERLGNLGSRLSAPFIAAASPKMFGGGAVARLRSTADVRVLTHEPGYEPWRLLRKSASARWASLATPRLLCRLPYGRQWDPAETFGFEEGIAGMTHDRFLWGSAAYAVAAVYATAFAEQGWRMNPAAGVPRLDGFPVCVYQKADEAVTKPCAEFLLNERVVEALMEAGLLPVVSHRNSDTVSLPCLQTIAEPRAAIHI